MVSWDPKEGVKTLGQLPQSNSLNVKNIARFDQNIVYVTHALAIFLILKTLVTKLRLSRKISVWGL